MKLFVAKHGETTWSDEGRVLGWQPGELTADGIDQARSLGEQISGMREGLRIYVSDLDRAVQTMQVVKAVNPGLTCHYATFLRERNFGDLEGKLTSEIEWGDFWDMPPDQTRFNAESVNDFTARVAQFMLELTKFNAEKSVLLITHTGVLNRLNYLTDPEHFTYIQYPHTKIIPFDAERILQHSRELLADR